MALVAQRLQGATLQPQAARAQRHDVIYLSSHRRLADAAHGLLAAHHDTKLLPSRVIPAPGRVGPPVSRSRTGRALWTMGGKTTLAPAGRTSSHDLFYVRRRRHRRPGAAEVSALGNYPGLPDGWRGGLERLERMERQFPLLRSFSTFSSLSPFP